jgi:hypothetical protein
MVNIRATVAHAFLEGVVSASLAAAIIHYAKNTHYVDRSYALVASRLRESGAADECEISRFEHWRKHGAVNQKRADALALCHVVASWTDTPPAPRAVSYVLEETDAWEHARRQVDRSEEQPPDDVETEQVLEELRLEGRYRDVEAAAVARSLATRSRGGDPREHTRLGRRAVAEQYVFSSSRQVSSWLSEQGLRRAEQHAFLCRHGQFIRLKTTLSSNLLSHVRDHLRAQGEYARLLRRAQEKSTVLTRSGPTRIKRPREALFRWYCRTILKQSAPAQPKDLARHLGFDDAHLLEAALAREYMFTASREANKTTIQPKSKRSRRSSG